MVARHRARRDIGRATYKFGTIGKTIRYGIVYRIRSDVLLRILLGILLGIIGTYSRNWISVAASRNRSVECMGSAILEHIDFVDIRCISNLGTS